VRAGVGVGVQTVAIAQSMPDISLVVVLASFQAIVALELARFVLDRIQLVFGPPAYLTILDWLAHF